MLQDLLNVVAMNWPAAIFFTIGLALLIAEMFMPGIGVAGGAGFICLIVSVVLKAQSLLEGIVLSIVILVIVAGAFYVSLRSVAKGRLSKTPLVLSTSTNADDGFVSSADLSGYIGREGVAATVLRPAGLAEFAGERLNVVSDGEFIAQGARIKVVEVNGPRVVVRSIS